MATKEINDYIEERYYRWHDYAAYHCAQAGIPDESFDVLNEVLCSLLNMPEKRLISLYRRESGKYRELDYYILRMIYLNSKSPTSPYQHKYKPIPKDINVVYSHIEIEDEAYEDEDAPGEIVQKTRIIREAIEELEEWMDPVDIAAFRHTQIDGEPGSSWEIENSKKCFDRAYKVKKQVKVYIENLDTRKLKVRTIWYNIPLGRGSKIA